MKRPRPTDKQVLKALDGVPRMPGEWVGADQVAARLSRDLGQLGQAAYSAQGVGLRLSRLAREGRCVASFGGYMNRYRSL